MCLLPMWMLFAGLRAWMSNSRGAFATCSRIQSGSSLTRSPSTSCPAASNAASASGCWKSIPISLTMRRHPRSSSCIDASSRISYRGMSLISTQASCVWVRCLTPLQSAWSSLARSWCQTPVVRGQVRGRRRRSRVLRGAGRASQLRPPLSGAGRRPEPARARRRARSGGNVRDAAAAGTSFWAIYAEACTGESAGAHEHSGDVSPPWPFSLRKPSACSACIILWICVVPS